MNSLIWGHRPLDIAQPGITLPFDFGLKQSLRQQGLPTALRQRGLNPAQTPLIYTQSASLSVLRAGYEYDHLAAYQALFQQLPPALIAEPFMTLLVGSNRTPLPPATVNTPYPLHFFYTYLKHHLLSRPTFTAFQRQVDILQLQPENLGSLNQQALMHGLETRINLWLNYAPQQCGQEIDTLVLYSHLARLCQHWGDSSGALINRLYDAGQALHGTEPLIRIRELAKIANQHPELITPLCQTPDATLQIILTNPAYAYFKTRLQHYQTQFAHLPLTAFNLHTLTLQQKPQLLLRMIGQTAQWLKHPRYTPPTPEPTPSLPEFAQQYHQRAWFKQVQRQVQHLLQERLDWYQTEVKLYSQIRLITLELGRRLYAQQQLVNPDDVHYLTPFELMGYGSEASLSPELKAIATVRRQANLTAEAANEPILLNAENTGNGEKRQGIACSPGIVRGPVRRFDPNAEIPVQAGEILVATRLNPGLSLWFPCCAGLIVEQANPLSVVMLLARELGLPAVAQLPTADLKTGEWIELDGNCGQITVVSPSQNG